MSRGLGRRCGAGCETWPDDDAYATCPVCGGSTDRYRAMAPLSDEEARSKRLHIEFEAFYEARDDRHELRAPSAEGPASA